MRIGNINKKIRDFRLNFSLKKAIKDGKGIDNSVVLEQLAKKMSNVSQDVSTGIITEKNCSYIGEYDGVAAFELVTIKSKGDQIISQETIIIDKSFNEIVDPRENSRTK